MHHTALIVDDHEGVRTALKRLLETHDYEVLTAANGADALTVLADCRVDVILLDLCMPVMDGIMFRERQLADSLVSRIPVVVISDVVGASDVTSSMGLEHAPKSNSERLVETVARVCLAGARERD